MPLYYFRCSGCGKELRRILKSHQGQVCECGSSLVWTPKGATSRVVETIDNGIMNKKIERLADAERLFKERNAATKKNQTGE